MTVVISYFPLAPEKWEELAAEDPGNLVRSGEQGLVFASTWHLWTGLSVVVDGEELVPPAQPQAVSLLELVAAWPRVMDQVDALGLAEWDIGYNGPSLRVDRHGADSAIL